jgi:hypothetical protein
MLLFFVGLVIGIVYMYDEFEPSFLNYNFNIQTEDFDKLLGGHFLLGSGGNFIDEILVLLIIVGGCLWGFSKEKEEDEYIARIRLNALIWAVLINYLLVVVSTIFIYGFWYLDVMLFNLVTPLIIFLLRYNYLLIKIKKA